MLEMSIICHRLNALMAKLVLGIVILILLFGCGHSSENSSKKSDSDLTSSENTANELVQETPSSSCPPLTEADTSVIILEEGNEQIKYLLTLEIFDSIGERKKVGEAEVEINVPSDWMLRVKTWERWLNSPNPKKPNLARLGFENPNDESLGLNHIACSNLYGWANCDFEDYQKLVEKSINYCPENIEEMELIQLGEYQWLRHIERFAPDFGIVEACTSETEHITTYLCEYKGGVINICFFHQGHDNNEEKLKQQEEILSSWHFVDKCGE